MKIKNIQPFILKSGDSINYQTNDNGPNSKLKAIFNILKAKWMLKYGTTSFQLHRMNSVLVETLEAFTLSDGNIIRESLDKTHLLPIIPTNTKKNTQACVASIKPLQKSPIILHRTNMHVLSCLRQVPMTLR